jgi:protein-arginine kinase activator protein McsA
MKKCSNCKTEKAVTEYSLSKATKDGFQHICKECYKTISKAFAASRSEAKQSIHVQSKVCLDCGLDKPSSQFGKRSTSLDKLNSYCKPCWYSRVKTSIRKKKLNDKGL